LFGLCKSMWVIELLVNLPSPHPRALTRPSTLKVLRVRKCGLTPPFVVFTFRLVVESIKELGGASTIDLLTIKKIIYNFRVQSVASILRGEQISLNFLDINQIFKLPPQGIIVHVWETYNEKWSKYFGGK
jgi:hypothetical protein